MKIGLQTWGSEGDIRPFLALAVGLRAAGHDVTLAVSRVDKDHKDYRALGETAGVRMWSVGHCVPGPDYARRLQRVTQDPNPIRQLQVILELLFQPIIEDMYAAACQLSADHDLVIAHMLVHPLMTAAEQVHRPCWTVSLMHSLPSRYLPPLGLPNLGPWLNPLQWRLAGWFLDRLLLPSVNELRHRAGLDPRPGLMTDLLRPPRPNLLAVSPGFCQPPPDWHPRHRLCGFFDLPLALEPWTPPEDLSAFLAAGPAPVFVGFGSMTGINPSLVEVRRVTELLIAAVRLAGCRALVQSRWDELPALEVPEFVYPLRRAPHARIFPQCAAVVHHGGAGTTHSATRAGCPSVVVVHATDQSFWASELRRLGLAGRPLFYRSVSAPRLARAIRTVLDDPRFAARAKLLAARMREEDGVGTVVRWLESGLSLDHGAGPPVI